MLNNGDIASVVYGWSALCLSPIYKHWTFIYEWQIDKLTSSIALDPVFFIIESYHHHKILLVEEFNLNDKV